VQQSRHPALGIVMKEGFFFIFMILNVVHRHIQYKAQKQHRGAKTLSSEQLPEYGNSSVLFECLMVDVVINSHYTIFLGSQVVLENI